MEQRLRTIAALSEDNMCIVLMSISSQPHVISDLWYVTAYSGCSGHLHFCAQIHKIKYNTINIEKPNPI